MSKELSGIGLMMFLDVSRCFLDTVPIRLFYGLWFSKSLIFAVLFIEETKLLLKTQKVPKVGDFHAFGFNSIGKKVPQ